MTTRPHRQRLKKNLPQTVFRTQDRQNFELKSSEKNKDKKFFFLKMAEKTFLVSTRIEFLVHFFGHLVSRLNGHRLIQNFAQTVQISAPTSRVLSQNNSLKVLPKV